MRRCLFLLVVLAVLMPGQKVAAAAGCGECCVGAPARPPLVNGTVNPWLGDRKPKLSVNRPTYLMAGLLGSNVTNDDDIELKFQISIKQHLLFGWYAGYTQKSFWRVADQEDSRPFRETNYDPELFWRSPQLRTARWGTWQLDFSPFEHESNGQREPSSRSWNRTYLRPRVLFEHFDIDLKLWHRYSEQARQFESDPAGDENPDIQDYLGNGELRVGINGPGDTRLELMGRNNLHTHKGAFQAELSVPMFDGNVALYLQAFDGYGESLIDYNRSLTAYGIGVRVR